MIRIGQPSVEGAAGPGEGRAGAFAPAESVARLQQALSGRLSPTQRRTLASLAGESDGELFGEALIDLARRAQRSDNLEVAVALYRWFESEECPSLPGIQARARRELDAVEGRGAFGARAEFLAQRFVHDASDPSMIFAMGVAGALFRVTRLAALTRLSANPEVGFLTRGLGARTISSLTGFTVEATAFPFLHRMGDAALGRSHPWDVQTVGHELAASFFTLGALKLSGWGAGEAFRRTQGLARGTLPSFGQRAFQQAGMFGGIMLGHGLESMAGLRPHQDGATTLTDALAMLLQFNVAGNLTRRAFGENFHRWERSVDLQTEALQRPSWRPPRTLLGQPALAMAGVAPSRDAENVATLEPGRPNVMMMNAAEVLPAETLPAGLGFEGNTEAEALYRNKPDYRIEYPPELDAALGRIEAQMRAPDYLEGSRQDLLRRRPDAEAVDRLWFHQLKDMMGRFPFIRLSEIDDSVFLTRIDNREQAPRSEWVQGARARLGERGLPGSTALKVLEVRIRYEDMMSRTTEQLNSPEGAFDQIGGLGSELQRVLNYSMHLMGESPDGGERIARIPAPSYIEALLQEAVGPDRVQFHYVDGAIPRDQVMALRSRRVSPVGLGRGLLWLGDIPNWVHPGAFAVHDGITHTCIDSSAAYGSYELSQRFYDWLRNYAPGDMATEGLLNRLADGEGHSETLTGGGIGRSLLEHFEAATPRVLQGEGLAPREAFRDLSRLLLQARQFWVRELKPETEDEARVEAERWELLFRQVNHAARPQIVYPPELEAAWGRIEQSFARPDYYQGNRHRLTQVRADPEDIDAVWLYQAAHLAEAMKKMTGEWVDAEAILEINPPELYPEAARTLREALSSLGERGRPGSPARRVLLMRVNDHSESDLEWAWERYIESTPVVNMVEQLTRGRLRLENQTPNSWQNYIPSFSLLEALYGSAFGRRVQFHPVPGEIPRDTVMDLRRRSVSPVGLSRQMIYISHFNHENHPVSFSGHDAFYHAGVVAQMGERYPRIAGFLYDRAPRRLPPGQIREDFLDALSDLNVPDPRGLGLKMFRTMMEKSLDSVADRIQEAETAEEFQARFDVVLENVEGFRSLVLRDFDSEPSLSRGRGSFLGSLDAIESRIRTVRRLREVSDSLEIGAPPIRYDNQTLDAIKAIERHYAQPGYLEGTREELLAKRPPLDLADQLWFEQARDYARRIPGSEVTFEEAEVLLEPWRQDPRFDRSLIESTLAGLPRSNERARQVMQITLPPEMQGPFYGRPENPELRFLVGPPMTRFYESFMGGRIQLSDGQRVFRIPSLSLAEKFAQAVHGADRVQFHFVPGVLSRDATSSLRARRVSPVSLTANPLYFPDYNFDGGNGTIHPWSFSQHDTFEHAASDALVPRGVAEAAHWIYTRGRQSFPDSGLRENLLNQLTDLPLGADRPPFASLAELMARPWIEAHAKIAESTPSEGKMLNHEARILAEALDALVREEFGRQPDLAANRQRFEQMVDDLHQLFGWDPSLRGSADSLSRIEYPSELQANWDAIQTQFNRRHYLNPAARWRERNRMPEDWVDRHWQFQIQDWARGIPGARSRVLDLDVFLRPSSVREMAPDTDLLSRAIVGLGDRGGPDSVARRVIELEVPAEEFERIFHGGDFGPRSGAILGTFFSAEEMLDRRILLVEPAGDSIIFRIPSLSFYEKVLQARYGSDRVSFHYVPGGIARRQVMDLKSERAFPVGLARNKIFFGDLEEVVHPFSFTAHDAFFHATRDAGISEGFTGLAGRAYRHFERSLDREDRVTDNILHQLAELDNQVKASGGLSGVSRDLIYLLNRDFQRAQELEGSERHRAMAELDGLSGGVHAWIRSEMPPTADFNPQSRASFDTLMALRRALRQELRPTSPAGRRSE